MQTVAILIIIFYLLLLIGFIFTAIGLYAIAKRREIKNPWFAWVPLVQMWTFGAIADQYDFMKKGKQHKQRHIILILCIISAIGESVDSLIFLPINIAFIIFILIIFYKVFDSCDPEKSTLYTILSILPLLSGILIFLSRKKDLGLPETKEISAITEISETTENN